MQLLMCHCFVLSVALRLVKLMPVTLQQQRWNSTDTQAPALLYDNMYPRRQADEERKVLWHVLSMYCCASSLYILHAAGGGCLPSGVPIEAV